MFICNFSFYCNTIPYIIISLAHTFALTIAASIVCQNRFIMNYYQASSDTHASYVNHIPPKAALYPHVDLARHAFQSCNTFNRKVNGIHFAVTSFFFFFFF